MKIQFTNSEKEVLKKYPFKATPYYMDLANLNDPNDPILAQIMPRVEELNDISSSFDPLNENKHLVTSRLIHRYKDRVLLLTTGNCLVRCRFCLRKRFWNNSDNNCPEIESKDIRDAVEYIEKNRQIKEVILSGGDVLSLSNEKINELIQAFDKIKHIDVIRIASRMLVISPQRFNDELLDIFKKSDKLWMMTHFNHENEITAIVKEKSKQIRMSGVTILNQTVLLKGINDNPTTLINLCQKLTAIKIKPHYLFHIDPVQGVRHYATGVEKGLELLHQIRGKLSSISTPTFAIDLPDGGGKVALQYDYSKGNSYLNTEEDKYIEY